MIPALASLHSPQDYFLGVERSATGRAWRDRLDERGRALASAIMQRYELPDILARIIAGRGIGLDAVEDYLDPSIKRLMPDPYVLTGMEEAALRLAHAIERNEKIAIFGDYDVDGATAAGSIRLCIFRTVFSKAMARTSTRSVP